eukprot:TRINITY_DN2208_c1_g1_i1.p1 TRINITY_DN2208_c1_g1~~TRINITY_DN2208_c1_g1_i1.p1  ORF type:complete len:1022 (+),score=189.80 TRINITY_DN2208_c1_g1_i1:59-3124(+)
MMFKNNNVDSSSSVSPVPSRPSSQPRSESGSSAINKINAEITQLTTSVAPKKEEIEKKYTRELLYYENGFSRLGLVMMSLLIPSNRKAGDIDIGVTLDNANSIVSVDSGSLAEQYGIYPSLKVYKIIDYNKKECKVSPSGRIIINGPTTIRLTENSGHPQTGKVLPNRKYVLPDRPILIPSGFRSEDEQRPGVFGGVVRIRKDANSFGVRPGQVVQFSVRFDGNEFEAHLLSKKHKKGFGFRRRSTSLIRNDSEVEVEASFPIPSAGKNKKICMCGENNGSCPNVNNAAYGEHPEDKYPAHEDVSRLVPIPPPSPIKFIKADSAAYRIRFKNTNNLGETSTIVMQPSDARLMRRVTISPTKVIKVPNYTAMMYQRNGESRPCFKEIWFDGGRTIWLTDIDKKLTIPETENVPLVISRIRDMADYCRVQHNIGAMCNPTFSEQRSLKSLFTEVSSTVLSNLSYRWGKTVMRAWSIRNLGLEYLYNITKHNMMVGSKSGEQLFEVNGLHGTAEKNIISIAQEGFDTGRRSGQAYGAGEYFANTIGVPSSYTKGGAFVFICDVLVRDKSSHYNASDKDHDHSFVPEYGYIIVKNRDGWVQALPRYLVQVRKGTETSKYFPLRRVLARDDKDALLETDPDLKNKKVPPSETGIPTPSPSPTPTVSQSDEEEPGLSSTSVSEAESEVSPDEHIEKFSEVQPFASDVGMFNSTTRYLHVSGIISEEEVKLVTKLIKSKTGRDIDSLHYVDGEYSELYIRTSAPISLLNFASLNYFGGLGLEGTKTIIRFDDAAFGNDWSSWRLCKKSDCRGKSLLGVGGCCRVHEDLPAVNPTVKVNGRMIFQKLERNTATYFDIIGRLNTGTIIDSCIAIHCKSELPSKPTGDWKDLWCSAGTTLEDATQMVQEGFHFGSDRLSSSKCPISKGFRSAICPNDCKHCTVVKESNVPGIRFSESCKLVSPATARGEKAAVIRCRVRLPKKLTSSSKYEWHHPAIRKSPNPTSGKTSSLYVVNQPTDIIPLHIITLTAK